MNFLPSLVGSSGGLSLVRILGTVSRTIGMFRQVSPIINDLKPLISKVPVLMNRLSNIRNTTYNLYSSSINNTATGNIIPKTPNNNVQGPVFFQ